MNEKIKSERLNLKEREDNIQIRRTELEQFDPEIWDERQDEELRLI